MSTKTLTLALFMFTAITLTHAALVDYRSGAAETQPQYRKMDNISASQMLYLQARKLAAPEITIDVGSNDRRSIWRGVIKSKWTEFGLCCGVFELLVKMKGSLTRIMILKALHEPRNKLQLANELGINWKAIDNHMTKLLQYSLVIEVTKVGTCTVYSITQKGSRALELAEKCRESEPPDCLDQIDNATKML